MGTTSSSSNTNLTKIKNVDKTDILNENDISTVLNNTVKNNSQCSSLATNQANNTFGTIGGDFVISGAKIT